MAEPLQPDLFPQVHPNRFGGILRGSVHFALVNSINPRLFFSALTLGSSLQVVAALGIEASNTCRSSQTSPYQEVVHTLKLARFTSLFQLLSIRVKHEMEILTKKNSHENQAFSPALPTGGRMRLGAKADLLGCLEAEMHESSTISGPMADAIILDGSAVVQILNPGASSTLQEYGDGSVYTTHV